MFMIKADVNLCEAYANCVIAAPEYFDVNDETGIVTVLEEQVTDERRGYVENAVRSCPVAALRLERMGE